MKRVSKVGRGLIACRTKRSMRRRRRRRKSRSRRRGRRIGRRGSYGCDYAGVQSSGV
jgi:hypothetical protein